jgi:hypothetical protein
MNHEKSETQDIEMQLPPIGERVIVASPEFRCLGYLDAQGIWRHDKDGSVIQGVIDWRSFPD